MTNSDSEIERLVENYYTANQSKNKLTRTENAAKKELQDFVDSGSGQVSIEINNNKITFDYGELPASTTIINPKKLYEYCVKLEMEEDFWDLVSVNKTEAQALFTDNQLSKVYEVVDTSKWTIKKVNGRNDRPSVTTTTET